MKDYSNNKEEKKDFIVSYKVDESHKSIKVLYADGNYKRFVYTEKCEKDILKKMKMQVNKAYKNYKIFENNYDKMNIVSIIALTFLVITSLLMFISPLYFVIPLCSAGVGIFAQIKAFQLKKIKDDLRKNYLFLKNEYVINDKEMCERAFRYCYRIDLKERLNDKQVKFTINNTDAFTFEEMIYLTNQLQFYKEKQNEKYTKEQVISKKKIK